MVISLGNLVNMRISQCNALIDTIDAICKYSKLSDILIKYIYKLYRCYPCFELYPWSSVIDVPCYSTPAYFVYTVPIPKLKCAVLKVLLYLCSGKKLKYEKYN